MKSRYFWNYFLITVILAAMLLPGARQAWAQSETTQLEGWLTLIWGDAPDGSHAPTEYTLTDKNGQNFRLDVSDEFAGAAQALDRRQVKVEVETAEFSALGSGGKLRVKRLAAAQESALQSNEIGAEITGTQKWLTIMCKFKNITTEPKNYAYFSNMYGDTYPGLNHYWKEVSYNKINITGSTVAGTGWYVLPQNRSYYVYNGYFDFDRATNDCLNKADASVNFNNFVGINLMFNAELNGYAWGGSQYMTRDGATRIWYMTWEPPWGYENLTVMSHEMGHGFGLPHSSGMYGQTYDNAWDVMSNAWYNCSYHATYGCLGQHTISYHKDMLGWIDNKYTVAAGYPQSITIDHLALAATSNYQMAKIPINGSTQFYTVEVRQQSGYDSKLPAKAVVIHLVNTETYNPAKVVDVDKDGDTSDEGAQWLVAEVRT